MAPTISAIVTAFGRRQFLPAALASVRAQASPPEETLVVSDFPPEVTGGERWVEVHERDQGPKLAAALGEAKGDVLAFLDDDDLWEASKLDVLRGVFQDPAVAFFNHAHSEFFDGVPPYRPLWKRRYERGIHSARIPPGGFPRDGWRHYLGNGSSIAVRRSALLPYLAQFAPVALAVDDFLFWVTAESGGDMVFDVRPLTRVRVHAANSSRKRGTFRAYVAAQAELTARRRTTYDLLATFLHRPGIDVAFRPAHEKIVRDFQLAHRGDSPFRNPRLYLNYLFGTRP